MKLYCMRHGHAEQFPNLHGERPLSQKGVEEINRVAMYLRRCGVYVMRIKHSGKLRAHQSATILANTISDNNQNLEECHLLRENNSITLLKNLIQEWHDDTILVGHMPFISQLVSMLVLGDDSRYIVYFPPGGIVCLEQFENRWILNWVLRPELTLD